MSPFYGIGIAAHFDPLKTKKAWRLNFLIRESLRHEFSLPNFFAAKFLTVKLFTSKLFIAKFIINNFSTNNFLAAKLFAALSAILFNTTSVDSSPYPRAPPCSSLLSILQSRLQ